MGPANVSDMRMLRATATSESGTTDASDVMLRSPGAALLALALTASEARLHRVDELRHGNGHDQIEASSHDVRRHIACCGRDGLRIHHDLHDADGGQKRSVLVHEDEFARHRGNDAPHGLRDDDIEHGLRTIHAQRARSFELSCIDGLNAGAEDLGQVRARIEHEHDDAQHEQIHADAHERQPEERDVYLEEQRRAANHIDVGGPNSTRDTAFRHPQKRPEQPERNGQREADHNEAKRQQPAAKYRGHRCDDNGGIEEQVEELVRVPRLHPILLAQHTRQLLGRSGADNVDDLVG